MHACTTYYTSVSYILCATIDGAQNIIKATIYAWCYDICIR